MKSRKLFVQKKRYLIGAVFAAATAASIANQHGLDWLYLPVAVAFALYLAINRVTHIDLERNIIHFGWYLVFIIPVQTQRAPLEECQSVQLRKKIDKSRTSRGSARVSYPVSLKGTADYEVKVFRSEIKARVFAEKLARLLQLALHDSSYGRRKIRQPQELDMSLGERLLHRGKRPSYPTGGSGARIRTTPEARGVRLRMPGQPLPLWAFALFFAVIISIGTVVWFTADGIQRVMVLAIMGAIAIYMAYAFIYMASPMALRVTPDQVNYRKFLSRRTMKLSEVEQLILTRLDMYLVGDKKVMGLPYDFHDKQEANYVRDLIRYMAVQGWEHAGMRRSADR